MQLRGGDSHLPVIIPSGRERARQRGDRFQQTRYGIVTLPRHRPVSGDAFRDELHPDRAFQCGDDVRMRARIGRERDGDSGEETLFKERGRRVSSHFLIAREENAHRRNGASVTRIAVRDEERECGTLHILGTATVRMIAVDAQGKLIRTPRHNINVCEPEQRR